MKRAAKPVIQLVTLKTIPDSYCFWCERELIQCGLCKGTGLYKGSDCKDCNGQKRICPIHKGEWMA